MKVTGLFRPWQISASGMQAEWKRMQVIAGNLANADTTRTPGGGPYRRRRVVFATTLGELRGVEVEGVVTSAEPPRMVHDPGHPDADAEGYVAMPNVRRPEEMVDMMAAGRAYQANLAAMRSTKRIFDRTIKLLG